MKWSNFDQYQYTLVDKSFMVVDKLSYQFTLNMFVFVNQIMVDITATVNKTAGMYTLVYLSIP